MRAGKENINNQLPRSLGVQGRNPFRDITNVADSRQALEDKHGCVRASTSAQGFLQSVGHSVARTQHLVNPFAAYSDQNTSSTACRGVGPTNALEKKRYNNQERYLLMTPEQWDIYLQRNREYKWSRRQNLDTDSDVAAFGDPSMPSSEKIIFQESLVNPVIGRQIMVNPSGLSTSHCTSETTDSQNRTPITYLIGEDNRRISSDGTSCRSATESSMYRKRRCGHVSTTVGKDKQAAAAYWDMGNDSKRRRLSNGLSCISASQFSCGTACCSTAGKENGYTSDLLDQYVPVQMQHHVTREQEDHDNTIYMPRDNFPAVQDEPGQAEDMTENSDEDEEGNVFIGQVAAFEYLSY